MIMDTLEFKVSDKIIFSDDNRAKAIKIASEKCPEGWTPDSYYNSRDSFFYKGEEYWARTTIRKWE